MTTTSLRILIIIISHWTN